MISSNTRRLSIGFYKAYIDGDGIAEIKHSLLPVYKGKKPLVSLLNQLLLVMLTCIFGVWASRESQRLV